MSPEILLIKVLCSYDLWKLYRELVPKSGEPLLEGIYKALDRLLDEVQREVSLDELETFYASLQPNNSKEENEFVSAIFNELRETTVADDVVSSCIRTIRERAAASRLAVECINVVEGRRDFKSLVDQFREINSDVGDQGETVGDVFVTDNLEDLYENTIGQPGLRWRLGCLNRSLGSLRKGNFGFIFARPETGKTTFLASEITFFANQTDAPILWFNNEQVGSEVALYCYRAALGLTTQELMSDRTKHQQKYLELTKGNIRIFDSSSIHRKQVEQLCAKYQPALVVFDQIDKLKGFPDDREDLRLGSIYIWARELAKTYCPVIGVSQAGGTAEGKKWLNMDDVANAKTAKQAEGDWILGLGKIHDVGYEYIRFLNICKNKLAGDDDTLPELRHGKMEAVIEPQIGRYRDL